MYVYNDRDGILMTGFLPVGPSHEEFPKRIKSVLKELFGLEEEFTENQLSYIMRSFLQTKGYVRTPA